jgi:glyoxylate utilization-related uncharacterized protein
LVAPEDLPFRLEATAVAFEPGATKPIAVIVEFA